MEDKLRMLQARDTQVSDAIAKALRTAVSELLPRVHLHVIENGNPAHLRAEIVLSLLPDQMQVQAQVELCQLPPRATKTTTLTFQNDASSHP